MGMVVLATYSLTQQSNWFVGKAGVIRQQWLQKKKIIPKRSITRIAKSALREQLQRHQTTFTPKSEGMELLEKFNLPKFILYDGKSDPRSHISYFKQIMVLWNHLEALMCKVFPSSLVTSG